MPEEIGELKNLTALNLSFNDITHIPEGVWKLTKLKTFSAVGNKLTNIPKEIGNLKNLEYLNVCGNEIESFPLEMGLLKNLYSLDISCNPALMSQNKWIRKENWSRDKKIEKINRTILGLPSLEYLYLSNKFGSKYGYTSKDLLKIKSQGDIAAEDEAIESATQMFEEAEREAAQAASQVVARESYYSKFGQFFKSIWSRFANSRFSQVLKNIGQTLFSNR